MRYLVKSPKGSTSAVATLDEWAKLKQFSATQISRWKKKFPDMENLKCECKRHSQSCGCFSKQFILNARINHFCCLQQCTSAQEYARRMRVVSEIHCKDIHIWKGGECGFHASTTCSCGACEDENTCDGKVYSTKT